MSWTEQQREEFVDAGMRVARRRGAAGVAEITARVARLLLENGAPRDAALEVLELGDIGMPIADQLHDPEETR
jgi:hypothetical protein